MTDMASNAPLIGILGGGQLARMLCIAAARLGVLTLTLERDSDCPAAHVSSRHIEGDWNDPRTVRELARRCDAITIENEFIDAGVLETLEADSIRTVPSSLCLAGIQDKLRQRDILRRHGIPSPPFAPVDSRDDLERAAHRFGYPFLLKLRRGGYDGKGNRTLRSPGDIDPAWNDFGGSPGTLLAEGFCRFRMEIAQMTCRAASGETADWPVVETLQKDHVCHMVKAPADIAPGERRKAREVARAAVEAMGGTGSIGVEMFLTGEGQVLVNELAPRVHNSGHYTIESCIASQFENHVRALLGWPLGSTAMTAPAAVMINILGDADGPGFPRGVKDLLDVPGARLHLYGKRECRRGRKMGHITVLADSAEDALERARRAADTLSFDRNR